MIEGYIDINNVPTHILCWGTWINDHFNETTKDIVLVITGNPGLPGFYSSFASTLFNELNGGFGGKRKFPIWIIGHAGHDEPKKELGLSIPPLRGNESLYDLEGQVKHKIEFIIKFIPKSVKLHIVSHSVGAKISLELLKNDDISKRVQNHYLLFPTIENMFESRNGFFFKILDRIFIVLQCFYYMFSYLPLRIRTIVLYFLCCLSGYPNYFLGTVIKSSNPATLDKVWFLAKDEIEKINDIDEEVIRNNIHRLKFYYGITDGWVPIKFYKNLLVKFPGIDAELCQKRIDHGFVVSHGPTMGRMVAEWINQRAN